MAESPPIPLSENPKALALVALWHMRADPEMNSDVALNIAKNRLINPLESFSNLELTIILAAVNEG